MLHQLSDGHVRFAGFDIPAADTPIELHGEIILGIRPSDLEDADVWTGEAMPTIEVVADVTEELGSEVNVLFQIDAPPLERDETAAAAEEPDAGELFVAEERHAVFTARVDARTRVTPGASIRLTVNPERFHYFDPETGLAISRTHAAAPA